MNALEMWLSLNPIYVLVLSAGITAVMSTAVWFALTVDMGEDKKQLTDRIDGVEQEFCESVRNANTALSKVKDMEPKVTKLEVSDKTKAERLQEHRKDIDQLKVDVAGKKPAVDAVGTLIDLLTPKQ